MFYLTCIVVKFLLNRRKVLKFDTMYFLLFESILMSHRAFSFSNRLKYQQLNFIESNEFENNSKSANLFDNLVLNNVQIAHTRNNQHKS